MRAWRGLAGGLLTVVLAGCGIVPHPEQQARRDATDRVRAKAMRFGTSLWAGLRETDAAGAQRVIQQHQELLGPFDAAAGPWENGVLGASAAADGTVRLDLAFRDKADAGGGWSAAQADQARLAYGPETYDRLVGLKDDYDPTNLFRLNQNIEPSRG